MRTDVAHRTAVGRSVVALQEVSRSDDGDLASDEGVRPPPSAPPFPVLHGWSRSSGSEIGTARSSKTTATQNGGPGGLGRFQAGPNTTATGVSFANTRSADQAAIVGASACSSRGIVRTGTRTT